MWHKANELAAQFMDNDRFENIMWSKWRRDYEFARKEITTGLMMVIKDDLEPCNELLPEILRDTLNPGDIRRIVGELQLIHWGPSPSPAQASTWSGDLEPPVPEPPRVIVAAAPAAAESVTSSAALVDPVVAPGSNAPVIIDLTVPMPPVTAGDFFSNAPRWGFAEGCAMSPFCPGNKPVFNWEKKQCAHYERAFPVKVDLKKNSVQFEPRRLSSKLPRSWQTDLDGLDRTSSTAG
jgi:hypothetical protein